MSFFVALFAASLSLGSPNDYFFTHPTNVPTSLFMGKGIGPDGDYSMIRAEDIAFLDEAYAERCNVDFSYGGDSSFGRTATLPVVKIGGHDRRVPGTIFSEWDMVSCFPLSCDPAMESTYPAAFILDPFGSHVTSSFSFRTPPAFAEVTGSVWQVEGLMGLRYVGGNVNWPNGGGLVSTNDLVYWGDDAAMTNSMSGRIPRLDIVKRLYGALDKFEYAVESCTFHSLTNFQYIYRYKRTYKNPIEFTYTEHERYDGVVELYASGVTDWQTDQLDEPIYEDVTSIAKSITETRDKTERWNISSYSMSTNQEYYVYFDSYVAEDVTSMFQSTSNSTDTLCFLSPVTKSSAAEIEILGAALLVKVRRNQQSWVTTYSLATNDVYEVTDPTVRKAMMVIPCVLPTPVLGRIVGDRQMYRTSWAVTYLMNEVNREFGSISDETPPNLATQPSAGVPSEYGKRWICQHVTSFLGTTLYVFYRRIFNSVAY